MKVYLLLVLLLLPQLAFAQAAPFRGYWVIETTLGQRISASGLPIDLGRYTSDQGLLYLLGYWDDDQSPRVFQNSQGNALNMLIYYVGLSALADDLAANCQGLPQIPMNASFASALNGVCSWPAPEAQAEKQLMAFWIALMGYDAPEAEYEAWRDFIRGPAYQGQPAQVAVRAMALSILMNPYFLAND